MLTCRVFICCAAAALALACGKWSSSEQREIDAFRTSIVKAEEVPGTLAMTEEQVTAATAALREALAASDIVTDPVLAQLHPELPEQYRTHFVPAVRMRLAALDTLRKGEPTTAKELEWQIPMAEWGKWYDRALPTLRQNIGR